MTTDAPLDLRPLEVASSPRRSRRRVVVVLALLVVAVLVLLSQGLLHSLNYFETLAQAEHQRAALSTKVIRLEGVVEPHSIRSSPRGANFVVVGGKYSVRVHANGTPPQLFQANIPVVLVGHFTSATSSLFDCTQILVKHTANYIAAHPSRVRAPNGTTR